MRGFRGAAEGLTPMLTTMFLMGSAVILAGGFYFARDVASDGDKSAPNIGMWSDDGNDRLLVVLGDPDADWQDVEVRTDVPTRVRLDGEADAMHGTLSPGGTFVPMLDVPKQVVGGDAISACAVGGPRTVAITLRDAPSNTVVFEQTMALMGCR